MPVKQLNPKLCRLSPMRWRVGIGELIKVIQITKNTQIIAIAKQITRCAIISHLPFKSNPTFTLRIRDRLFPTSGNRIAKLEFFIINTQKLRTLSGAKIQSAIFAGLETIHHGRTHAHHKQTSKIIFTITPILTLIIKITGIIKAFLFCILCFFKRKMLIPSE